MQLLIHYQSLKKLIVYLTFCWLIFTNYTRSFSTSYQRTTSLAENPILLNFLLNIVSRFQPDLINASHLNVDWRHKSENGNRASIVDSVWEVHTTVFTMISEMYSRVGNILPVNSWISAVAVSMLLLHSAIEYVYGKSSV